MLFNSLEFFIFFAGVFALYWILPLRAQNIWLLIVSLVFYGWWDWRFVFLMLGCIGLNFGCALAIGSVQNQAHKKLFLAIAVIGSLAALCFFKYFNFFTDNVRVLFSAFGMTTLIPAFHIILPVGISFFTFQALSYTVDVYRGCFPAVRRCEDLALYISFFPQLVAGPIERAAHLLGQIASPRRRDAASFQEGVWLVLWGLFEKIFVAGNLARFVNPVFNGEGPYEGQVVLVALYAFAFQIFCDFDAYSNIARGVAKFLGFDLMVNFNLPYFAANPREFWQRWHISLSTWLRDYLYIPLGGGRFGKWLTYRNLALTMFLGGLWHGASWTFIIWGVYQGGLLIGHRMWSEFLQRSGKRSYASAGVHKAVLMLGFFHLVLLGWLVFRAESLQQAWLMFTGLFSAWQMTSVSLKVFVYIAPVVLLQLWQYRSNDLLVVLRQHWVLQMALYAGMVYCILGWGIMSAEEFIYFQF